MHYVTPGLCVHVTNAASNQYIPLLLLLLLLPPPLSKTYFNLLFGLSLLESRTTNWRSTERPREMSRRRGSALKRHFKSGRRIPTVLVDLRLVMADKWVVLTLYPFDQFN